MSYKEEILNGFIPEGFEAYDCHAHIGKFPGTAATVSSASGLVDLMDRINIKKSVVSATLAITGDFRDGNNVMLKAVEAHPDKILGYAVVNPNFPDGTIEEIERCKRPNVVGIKIHPAYIGMPVTSPALSDVFSYADKNGTIVLVHTWSIGDIENMAQIISKYPGGKYILAHSGTETGAPRTAELIKSCKNVYCDIATSVPRYNVLEYLVRHGDYRKILFGTDCMLFDQRITYARIMLSDISDEAKERIMSKNFKELFADAKL